MNAKEFLIGFVLFFCSMTFAGFEATRIQRTQRDCAFIILASHSTIETREDGVFLSIATETGERAWSQRLFAKNKSGRYEGLDVSALSFERGTISAETENVMRVLGAGGGALTIATFYKAIRETKSRKGLSHVLGAAAGAVSGYTLGKYIGSRMYGPLSPEILRFLQDQDFVRQYRKYAWSTLWASGKVIKEVIHPCHGDGVEGIALCAFKKLPFVVRAGIEKVTDQTRMELSDASQALSDDAYLLLTLERPRVDIFEGVIK
jgi:hypothetical protein